MAKKVNIKVNKIIIYPYGGLTILEDYQNNNINKELAVAINGVVFQSIYFIFIYFLYSKNIIREYTYNIFNTYNSSILFFNLLPIYPLDGSKIINLLLNKYFSFKQSIKITIILSLITILLITKYYLFNYTFIIILFLLFNNIIKYYQNIDYLYYKFLLERYLYNINFKNTKIIRNKNNFYKNYNHLIKNKDKYFKEKEFLKNLFDITPKI